MFACSKKETGNSTSYSRRNGIQGCTISCTQGIPSTAESLSTGLIRLFETALMSIFQDISGDEITVVDLILWGFSLWIYCGYLVVTYIKYKNQPSSINLGLNIRARRQWIRFVMCTPGQEILIIQSMRNSIMESVFLGTMCSLQTTITLESWPL